MYVSLQGTPWPWKENMVGFSWAVPGTYKTISPGVRGKWTGVLTSCPLTLTHWLHTDSPVAQCLLPVAGQ